MLNSLLCTVSEVVCDGDPVNLLLSAKSDEMRQCLNGSVGLRTNDPASEEVNLGDRMITSNLAGGRPSGD